MKRLQRWMITNVGADGYDVDPVAYGDPHGAWVCSEEVEALERKLDEFERMGRALIVELLRCLDKAGGEK